MKPRTEHSRFLEIRLERLLSELPPTNFSVHPRDFETNQLWRKIYHGKAAVVKSWLRTATRCGGPRQLPQLRHVSTGPPDNPVPTTPRPQNHFLIGDSESILEAALEKREASYWCLLECSDTKKKPGPLAINPSKPSDLIGPRRHANDDVSLGLKLRLSGVCLGPNAPCSGLVVTYAVLKDHNSRRSQLPHWLIPRYASIRCECAVPDPFDSKRKPMEFAHVIRCGGKFYAISLQGAVAAMEVIDTRLRITAVGPTRAIPTSRSRFFKEHLVEMKGEILLVYLIHYESVEVVDDIEVFRLDLDKLELIKVEKLQGKTMFLKESKCDWVESSEFGCRDDCVFFAQGKENQWRVYDMKKCVISCVL